MESIDNVYVFKPAIIQPVCPDACKLGLMCFKGCPEVYRTFQTYLNQN